MHRNARSEDMHFGKWNAPGGKVEPGETPGECAVREVFEETALTVRDPRMRGVLTFPAFDDEEDWYVFVFTAEKFSGDLKQSCHEGDLFWIEDVDLMELPLWEGDRIFMKWLDADRFFSGKFVYSTSGYESHSVVFYGDDRESSDSTEQESSNGKVLFLDSNPVVSDTAVGMLFSLGYSVDVVLDGKAVLSQYRAAMENGKPYRIVIMNLSIPRGMGGTETVRRLLAIDPEAAVIISSGFTGSDVMSSCHSYGFKAALPKPYTVRELFHALDTALGS